MKTPTWMKRLGPRIIPFILLCSLPGGVLAVVPGPPGDPPPWLDYWPFSDTNNWLSYYGRAPVSFTNLAASPLGNGNALVVDSPNAAWLQYHVFESGGATNLTVERGSVMFWFAPSWSGTNAGGSGPGDWGRLIEVGAYTTNASYGWWSLYVDPAGANLYFAAQTNGYEAVYLSAPIEWTTNRWHLIALTYSATNTALYLDGQLATNGPGLTVWPGPDVLADGFLIGSDRGSGLAQARGMFDDLATYDYDLGAATISSTFGLYSIYYLLNPANFANISSATSTPTFTPTFNAVTGSGYLAALSTNAAMCVTSSNIWMTNVVATLTTNGTMDARFEIAGGAGGVRYDVFANSVLSPASHTNYPWAWMGQGYHCTTYLLTNLPLRSAFLILGHPTDSDADGLTDAYERLVSKTDPNHPDTDGDGVLDGWEIVFGTDPRNQDSDGDGVIDQMFEVFIMQPKSNSTLP